MARDGYLIGESALNRLRAVVQRVEGTPNGSQITRIATAHDEGPPYYIPASVRFCTFTGTWASGESKTITLLDSSGATQAEASATNVLVGVSAGSGVVARDGTSWKLISVNLTTQPGYSSSGTQVLAVVNGLLRWVGTTACT